MRTEGDFTVLDRAETQTGLLTMFDIARGDAAMEAAIARDTPHERERLQEQHDMADQQADRENGRIARSGYGTNGGYADGSGRGRKDKGAIDPLTLADLLNNASYRALHERAVEALDNAEREIAIALEAATGELGDIRDAMADMEANALRDANGNVVFMDGDRFVYANGKAVPPDVAATIVAKPGVEYPSYADYKALQDAEADQLRRVQELEALRGRLDGYRDELHDNDNPPAPSRLPVIIDEIEVITDQAHEAHLKAGDDVSVDQAAPVQRVDMSASAIPALPA